MAIGKYYVAIEGISIPRITRFQAYKFVRNQTSTTSFAGTERVDRSAPKYRVVFVIAICTAAEMQQIVGNAEQITRSVTFYDGTTSVTKNMIISLPQVPQPIYKYGNRLSGVYYQNLRVEMEEA